MEVLTEMWSRYIFQLLLALLYNNERDIFTDLRKNWMGVRMKKGALQIPFGHLRYF